MSTHLEYEDFQAISCTTDYVTPIGTFLTLLGCDIDHSPKVPKLNCVQRAIGTNHIHPRVQARGFDVHHTETARFRVKDVVQAIPKPKRYATS